MSIRKKEKCERSQLIIKIQSTKKVLMLTTLVSEADIEKNLSVATNRLAFFLTCSSSYKCQKS